MHSRNLNLHFASPFEFTHIQDISQGNSHKTTQVMHNEMQIKCAKHTFISKFNEEENQRFIQICKDILDLQDDLPFFLPFTFVIEPNKEKKVFPEILTIYHEKKSLQDVIDKQLDSEFISESQKITFLYCVSCFLEKLHQNNRFHGRLKASNILVDDNFYPLVTDLFFYKIDNEKAKNIDFIISRAPELLKEREYTTKSEIYSFGIIALQLFQQKINIFSEDHQSVSSIEREIKHSDFESNLSILPDSIRPIIEICLSHSAKDRPDASKLRSSIETIISKKEFSHSYSSLQKYINSKNEIVDEDLKKDADSGNLDSMFKYAIKLKEKNKVKSLLYFRYGAKQNPPHSSSKQQYESICKKLRPKVKPKPDDIDESVQNQKIKILRLMNDQFFTQEDVNTDKIGKDVIDHYNDEEDLINFDEEKLRKKGFILTKGAKRRLNKIFRYLKEGVPVLLEGPTGTSKTKSAEIVCEMLETHPFKYNLSSETKTGDLLGRYVGDPNSWSGIKMHEGPFLKAFEENENKEEKSEYCVLLLDEINLANQECLHFIEEALDSDEISTEIPGMPWRNIKKDPKFRLIATQNPNKGLFANKRQDLGLKFLSRFQVIDFPKLENDELKEIAKGLANVEDFKFRDEEKLINDLVDFHVEWSERPEIKDEVQCFTVREIEATIHALRGEDALNPYDAVMTIYGARYQKERKNLLIEMLLSYESFRKYKDQSDENKKDFNYVFDGIPFPKCFHNMNLADALRSVFFSFKMNRHVILTGKEGCGLTKIARLIAKCHNKKLKNNKGEKEFICICTEETKGSDLIGGQKAIESKRKSKFSLEWKPGFLSTAIKTGHCAILDSIDEATSTVTERINPLLDIKNDSANKKFPVPENPNEPEIEINPNFRLLCTCKYDKINQMSPAFINRFDVIVLDDQLEQINKESLQNLIKMLMNENLASISIQEEEISKEEHENDSNSDSDDDGFDAVSLDQISNSDSNDSDGNEEDNYSDENNDYDENDDQNDEENNNDNNDNESDVTDIQISDEIIDLVYKKLDIKNLPTFQNLSQFCKAVAKYIDFFGGDKSNIPMKDIVDFSYKMLQKTVDFNEIPLEMMQYLLDHLKNKSNEINGEFIYNESLVLKTFIAKLYAASIVNLPVCVYGPTGVGKTSAAEQFSKERSKNGFQKHSFHAGTKPNHFYATTTIQDKKISLEYGSLTNAMINGQVFIADEMNLSSIANMKSLAPALEPSIGKEVFIPGIGETISIHPGFFFIACQNELGTLGRNAIPSSISSRFRYFDYPELGKEEIAKLCVEKRRVLYDKVTQEKLLKDKTFIKDSRNLGIFMIELNSLKQRVIPKWSFRDVTKIFKRVHQQDMNSKKYDNITFYHQVLFYTISIANEEDSKAMLEEVCDLIKNIFDIPVELRTELIECYKDSPKIKSQFIMKGRSGVLCTKSDVHLPKPILNTLFIFKLSHYSEPIIFMGESGYKTFISKKILDRAKSITLNQESTNAQLLGKSYPFTITEAKLFYLETLYKMLNLKNDIYYELKELLQKNQLTIEKFIPHIIPDPKKNQDELMEMLKEKINYKVFFDTIFVKYLSKRLPQSFKYAFINIATKLFTASEYDNDNIISNFVFEFKPGLFLSSIFEGKSLILKNLSNLPTIVFERFNELFSGEHCLTLQEDINNTFTNEKMHRKLTKFNDNFRVLATCPPNSLSQLSEAVLSRFTVIYTHQYKPKDQKKVLCNLENLKIDKSLIDYVINFSKQMNEESSIRKSIPFRQMINIIEMCSNLIDEQTLNEQLEILKVVLYRVVIGLLEKRDRNKSKIRNKIIRIFEKIDMKLPIEITAPPSNENPLVVDSKDDGCQLVKSNISKLSIVSPTACDIDKKYTYTQMFIELVDTIFLGVASKTPVILEGMPGQGKQTAINNVAKMLGYNIVNIVISQSTKADDLLGKLNISYDDNHNIKINFINTELIKVIESDAIANSSIIVFHNINHASSAVLEVLQTIFDPHEKNICLTNGTIIPKRKLNIVGIYNQQNGYSNRGNLPSSLIYSSLYYIVNNPSEKELRSIIKTLFERSVSKLVKEQEKLLAEKEKQHKISPTELKKARDEISAQLGKEKSDWKIFNSCFNKTNELAKDNNTSSVLTLNDVVKYILLRRKTFSKLDRDIISQMIFAYRFINEKTIQEVKAILKSDLNVKDMNFSPSFNYDTKQNILKINVINDQSDKSQNGISIKLYSKNIDQGKIFSEISSLTLPQKHCLLFLACSVLSKRSCILQGATSSGKSHIIRLFAKMLGQDLIVYQMNKDTGISILTGQTTLSSSLSDTDIDTIIDSFSKISIDPLFNKYIDDNFNQRQPSEWKSDDFSDLFDYIKNNISEISDKSNLSSINDATNEIKKVVRQENRFCHQESAFINAMKDGKWVLIDGIESAPPEIAQKISTLCGDEPELHLIERGKDNYFSRKKIKEAQLIHDNFHLFVTYNPLSQKENISLDQTFANKCVSFTLPQIDSIAEYSAQVLHGSLLRLSYPNNMAIQISARMSKSHEVAKNKSINNNDVFAGDLQFTGRTLKFIASEFKLFIDAKPDIANLIYKPVCNSFHSFYWNSEMKNEGTLKKEMIDAFVKDADSNIVTNLNQKSDDPRVRNKEFLKLLLNVQLFACKILEETKFKDDKQKKEFINDFVNKCNDVKLSDIPFLIKHIEDTLDVIVKESKSHVDVQFAYSKLKIILNIFIEINKFIPSVSDDLKDTQLNNKDLLSNHDLEAPLLKLQLLRSLQENEYINSQIPCIFNDPCLFKLFKIVIKMAKKQRLKDFKKFVSLICENQYLIPLIEPIFPYNLFDLKPLHTINYFLPMFLDLYKHNITFKVVVKHDTFKFKNGHSLFKPKYVFNKKSGTDLLLYPGTLLVIMPSKKDSHKKGSHKKDSHKKKSSNENKPITYTISEDTKEDKLMKKLYKIYGFTSHILSNNIEKIDLKAVDKLLPKKIPYPKEKQRSKLSLLFPNSCESNESQNIPTIASIWSLVYSMPNDSDEIWLEYLHPLESYIFKFIEQKFNLLNIKNIDDIFALTKWMYKNDVDGKNDDNLFIGSEKSYLWMILENSFNVNDKLNGTELEEEIKFIQDEINYYISAPVVNDWSTEEYIRLLQEKALLPYKEKLQTIINSNEEASIRSKLYELLKNVKTLKPTKKGHKTFIDNFINAINNIINEPSQIMLDKCEANYKELTKLLRADSSYSKTGFNWPLTSVPPTSQSPTSIIKLYQHMLWYSQAYSIIEKITPDGTDLIKNILELSEMPDMQTVSKFLINKICKENNDDNKIDEFDINLLKSSLNAQFIMKLLKDRIFYDSINKLGLKLNNLEERLSEESEISWINQKVNQYPLKFQIVLPKFYANDIFSLLVCFEDCDKVTNGPLTISLFKPKDNSLAKLFKGFLEKEYTDEISKFTEFAFLVGKKIYGKYFPKSAIECNDKVEFLNFLNDLKKKETERSTNSIVIDNIIFIFNIAESLAKCPKFIFTFNDIRFLKKDWFSSDEFVNRYPSLVYWLSLNDDCLDQFQKKFSNYDFSDKQKLPFWLFALRILSSQKCIKFHCPNQSKSVVMIKSIIDRKCADFFKANKNSHIGANWINFLIPNVPFEGISNKNYKYLHKFVINLATDNYKNAPLVSNEKEVAIRSFVEKIVDKVFTNSIDELFDMSLSSRNKNETLEFIFDPKYQITLKISESMKLLLNNFINANQFKNLKKCVDQLEKDLKSFIDKLRELCKEVNEKIDEKCEGIKNNEYNLIWKDICNEIYKYNELFYDLIKNKNTPRIFNTKCKQMISIMKGRYLSQLSQDTNHYPLEVNIASFQYKAKEKLQFAFRGDIIEPYIFYSKPDSKAGDQFVCFRNDNYPFEHLEQSKLETYGFWEKIDKTVHFHYFYPYSPKDPKIADICQKEGKFSEKPYLIFGKHFKVDEFIKEFENCISSKLVSALSTIENDFPKRKFNTLEKLSQIKKIINDIIPEMTVKYSIGDDSSSLEPIVGHFNKFKTIFVQINQYVDSLQIYAQKNKIESQYKEASQIDKSLMFSSKFNIPFPSSNYKPSFDKSIFSTLNNCKFLSSPFISLENEDSIMCCFEKLDCYIGPIIPSLYSGSISLNFISFIDHPITIHVKAKKEKYNSWFYSSTFKPKDIAQIYLTLPSSSSMDSDTHEIEADIEISSPGLNSLVLESSFHIFILPQKIFFSCFEFPIFYDENKMFLCTDKLLSNNYLNFTVKNFNIKELLNYNVQIESLDENASPKPEKSIDYENNSLQIYIPEVDVPKRINCSINMKFSEKLMTKLIIDSIIVPFNFSFLVYDYNMKMYVDNTTVFYSYEYIATRVIKLHCKISSPLFDLFKEDKSVLFRSSLQCRFDPYYVKVVDYSLGEYFEIKEDTVFDINLKINYNIRHLYTSYISLKINNLEKYITVSFKEMIDGEYNKGDSFKKNLKQYNFYYGKANDGHWELINEKTNLDDMVAICSPFSKNKVPRSYISHYKGECHAYDSYKQNIFVYLDLNNKKEIIDNCSDAKVGKSWGLITKTIPLFGIVREQWYPVFSDYRCDIDKWRLLEINEKNKNEALKGFKGFPHWENNGNSFMKFAVEFKNKDISLLNVIKNILINEQLSYFRENLDCSNEILSQIDKLQKCGNDLEIIIRHNVIYLLFNSFRTKYSELRANRNYIYSLSMNKEVDDKIEELYSQYCQIEDDDDDENQVLREDNEKLVKMISDLNLKQIPIENQQQAYLITTEKNGIIPIPADTQPEFVDISTKGNDSFTNKSIDISLHEINMPKFDKLQDLNINKMNDFYLSCLKGTRTLPLFVKNISTEMNDANIDIAFNYLISLCNAFYCSINNKSIISQAVSDFSESFCSMIGKFSKAGMDVSKILPMKYIPNIEASQDFISYPSINIPYLPSDSWNIKVPLSDDYIYSTMSTTFNGAHVGEFKEQNKEPQLLDVIHPDDNTNVNIDTTPNQDNGTPIFTSLFSYQNYLMIKTMMLIIMMKMIVIVIVIVLKYLKRRLNY